jgi:fumarate hydratase, class II
VVEVPADKLWGAQTQRSLQHFSIGTDLIPREMITGYAILKKAAATANHASGRLDDKRYELIVATCNEILAGGHHDMFPLHVWMTGSGTQFNMNVNEVISNRCSQALQGVYRLALGGTAVGTGINSAPGFAEAAAAEIAKLTGLPFVTAPNKFTVQGAHDALVQLSGTLRTLAVSLYKIANDIRLMSCGPRAGFAELLIPENEPGSSIMPGKVNPTQCEALTMIAVQVMANDVAVSFGGAGGYLEMNVYKPLMIYNITHSITILSDGCVNFRKFLVEGTKPNLKKIKEYVERSLMLVTALAPVIGYDRASKIAHYAIDNDMTLRAAALKLGFVSEDEFDRVVDPAKMVRPYVAAAPTASAAG